MQKLHTRLWFMIIEIYNTLEYIIGTASDVQPNFGREKWINIIGTISVYFGSSNVHFSTWINRQRCTLVFKLIRPRLYKLNLVYFRTWFKVHTTLNFPYISENNRWNVHKNRSSSFWDNNMIHTHNKYGHWILLKFDKNVIKYSLKKKMFCNS